MAKKRPIEVWYRVGSVESGRRWLAGYSRRSDGGEQPWRTKREAQRESREHGMTATFELGERLLRGHF